MTIQRRRAMAAITLAAAGGLARLASCDEQVSGDSTIRGEFGGSEIVLRTTSRLAGAFDSLVWKDQEFIDSFDHGRQLQSACSFDCGDRRAFWPEAFNPTEAGSRADGRGPRSTSKLLSLQADKSELKSRTQMAFWLTPGEKSEGHPARNTTKLSKFELTRHVTIGCQRWPNVLDYRVTFHVPDGEQHTFAQFEAVTGYMPAAFSKFWKLDRGKSALVPLDDGPGEQSQPVVLATASGSHAMGVYSADQPSPGFEEAGYGRFRFARENVVKWNCVFRQVAEQAISPGDYRFRCLVVVGSLRDVEATLLELVAAGKKLGVSEGPSDSSPKPQ